MQAEERGIGRTAPPMNDRFISNTLMVNHVKFYYRIWKKLRFSSVDYAETNNKDVFLPLKKLRKRKPLVY